MKVFISISAFEQIESRSSPDYDYSEYSGEVNKLARFLLKKGYKFRTVDTSNSTIFTVLHKTAEGLIQVAIRILEDLTVYVGVFRDVDSKSPTMWKKFRRPDLIRLDRVLSDVVSY